jgi:hypothetical protein
LSHEGRVMHASSSSDGQRLITASLLVNTEQQACPVTAVSTGETSAFRMLLVEPAAGMRRALQFVMKHKFPKVPLDLAWDLASGLDCLGRRECDRLLIDTCLPGATWLELVRGVQASHSRVWFAVWSSYASWETVRRVHELQPMFFLYKPFAAASFTSGCSECGSSTAMVRLHPPRGTSAGTVTALSNGLPGLTRPIFSEPRAASGRRTRSLGRR